MRSSASVRRIGVSMFVLLLALTLHGLVPAGSQEDSSVAALRPTPSHTVRPRPTHTTRPTPTPTRTRETPTPRPPRPTPTNTDPYPGGVSLPVPPNGDSFFRVSDVAPSAGVERGLASFMWIALVVFAVGLVIRWFFIAARADDAGRANR